MGYLGRRIGLSQDKGDSTPGSADGAVGGGILDLFTQGYFERQDKIYNAPAIIPSGVVASGGIINDYSSGSDVYRAHIFTSTGELNVTELGTGSLPSAADFVVVGGGGAGGSDPGNNGAAGGGDLGAPVMEPDLDGSATEAPEMPKGGEI